MRSWSLAKADGHGRHWRDLREVAVIECLTTGHDMEVDRILWLAVVLLDLMNDDDSEPAVFEALLDPRIPVPAEATLLHGVATVHVVGQEHFGQITGKVRDLIGDRPVVGFDIQHATGFLDAEMGRHGRKTFYRADAYDVQAALWDAWGYRPTLSNAVTRLGIKREESFIPVANAFVTARLARVLANASGDALGNVPGNRWVDEDGDHGGAPPSRPQLSAIRDLGGDPRMVKNTRQAAQAIEELGLGMPQETPTMGEHSAESMKEAIPASKWVWLVVMGMVAGSAGRRCIAGSRRDSWTGIWTRSGSGMDRGGRGLPGSIPTRRSSRPAWPGIRTSARCGCSRRSGKRATRAATTR